MWKAGLEGCKLGEVAGLDGGGLGLAATAVMAPPCSMQSLLALQTPNTRHALLSELDVDICLIHGTMSEPSDTAAVTHGNDCKDFWTEATSTLGAFAALLQLRIRSCTFCKAICLSAAAS